MNHHRGIVAGSCLVIAVLAGLVMTATMVVRQQSPKFQCSNNLRQIGIASQMYFNQYRLFPYYFSGEATEEDEDRFEEGEETTTKGYQNIQLLFDADILDDSEVVICPISNDQPAARNASGAYTLGTDSCSYLWEKRALTDDDPPTTPLAACKEGHHPGGTNVLFLDGSVKWYPAARFESDIKPYLTSE